ncbi:MAG: ROK family protein, partial [Bacteroidales bacterium]|nr:ROK family protein [Bacteroidales bacterium]
MVQDLVIGIDVGGQTAKCGVVDARGNIVAQTVISSENTSNPDEFVTALAEALNRIIVEAKAEGSIRGIGVGIPNGNFYTGVVENAVNLVWAQGGNIPFAKMLQEQMNGIPVSLTNDANAAAMGEMTYGAARGMKNFIMITLGTGVGSGIVINGEVVYGHDGFAGELGHTCAVRHNGRRCNCGKDGCLETYASATGVARTAREWLDMTDEPSLLRSLDKIKSKNVYEAAKEGLLAKPQTFMNLSGNAVLALMTLTRAKPAEFLVVCDDINFEPGRLRFRANGSHGGHNGLRSIVGAIGDKFPRVRLG